MADVFDGSFDVVGGEDVLDLIEVAGMGVGVAAVVPGGATNSASTQ
jgi:hypothetical protein